MKTVAVFEAKTRLSEILVAVEYGEEYTITRHGTPVDRIKATRKGSILTDDEYRKAIEAGRD